MIKVLVLLAISCSNPASPDPDSCTPLFEKVEPSIEQCIADQETTLKLDKDIWKERGVTNIVCSEKVTVTGPGTDT